MYLVGSNKIMPDSKRFIHFVLMCRKTQSEWITVRVSDNKEGYMLSTMQ